MLNVDFLRLIVLPAGNADVTAADGFHPQAADFLSLLQGDEIQGVWMGTGKLLLGKENPGGQGSQCFPQHPVGAVAHTGFAQGAVKNHLESVCLLVFLPEKPCRPLRSHGVGGTGAFADLIDFTNGFQGSALRVFFL